MSDFAVGRRWRVRRADEMGFDYVITGRGESHMWVIVRIEWHHPSETRTRRKQVVSKSFLRRHASLVAEPLRTANR